MPNVSLKTVYQTLHDLAELGQISALDLGTGARSTLTSKRATTIWCAGPAARYAT